MDFIKGLFDMDFTALVPEMGSFLGILRRVLTVSVLIGPLLMLAFGLLYLFKPAPEANYRYGHRTYFGMGGVEAWRFSQKMAGLIFGGLGALLLIIMVIVVLTFGGKDLYAIADAVLTSLLWQVGLALAARLAVAILAGVYFDRDGERRKR